MLNRVMSKEETSLDEAQYKVPSNYMAMMQKKKKADAGQQMSDDEKKKNITTADREKLSKLASMLKKEETNDKETGDHVRTSDYKMSKVRLPDGRMVYRKVKREIKV